MRTHKCLAPSLLAALLLAPLGGALAAEAPKPADEELAYLRMTLPDEQLVESATRAPKPLSRIAENVTVVTSDEIEAMNAHTLAEVLDRVTGVFAQWFGVRHFGATVLPHIQGSGETDFLHKAADERHVTLLVDGVPLNLLTGAPAIDTLPLGIIDRIEVLKGPGSSAWGSALGGVVNVLTKRPGTATAPGGGASLAYGERDTFDARAEVGGAAGPVGYYLQGQAQHADWDNRGGGFENRSVFGKAEARLGQRVTLTLSGGGSRPEQDNGLLKSQLATTQNEYRSGFGQAALDAALGPALSVRAAVYRTRLRLNQPAQESTTYDLDGDGINDVFAGDLLVATVGVNERTGAQGRVAWSGAGHALVAGVDYERGKLELTTEAGALFQALGYPAEFTVDPSLERVGVYANDTASWGPLAVTAGIRWDDSSKTDPFWSPSVGATVRVGRKTLLRGLVARGFTIPPLQYVSGGGVFLAPNPDLEQEKVWSYELGAETVALPFLWCKATLFRHEVTDSLESAGGITVNGTSVWRTGVEAEAATAAWQGLSLKLGAAYVKVEKTGALRDQDLWQAKGSLSYWGFLQAQLLADYAWWDLGRGAGDGAHDDVLLDLVASKEFPVATALTVEVFGQIHNLTNGDRSWDADRGSASRWVEAGARLRF